MTRRFPIWFLSGCLLLSSNPQAAEIHLKNGDVLDGKPIPIQAMTRTEIERETANNNHYYPILMIHSGIKRYFVPAKQVLNIDQAGGFVNLEEYSINQKLGPRRQMLRTLGGVSIEQDFDEFGRRTVAFNLNGQKKPVVQGITSINPQYVTVTAMTDYDWEQGLSVTSLSEDTLSAVLRKVIDPQNPQQRQGLAVFYMKAGMYVRAGNELDSMIRDFPELKASLDELITQLRSVQAQKLLSDLRRRRDNGQYQLAALALRDFPKTNLTANVLKDLDELARELDDRHTHLDHARMSLLMLQHAVEDQAKQTALESLRSAVRKELDAVGLERLDAFLKFETDNSLTAEQKLALAYSGWVLGSAYAVTDLDRTMHYWEARHLISEYILTNNGGEKPLILDKLRNMEGITPEVVSRLLMQLKPVVETAGIKPGVAQRIEVEDADPEIPVAYHVLLPQEYSPNKAYPLIVALHPRERGPDAELSWWGGTESDPGQSQRQGYIVIAPEYIEDKLEAYDYAARSHYIVLKALRDARTRFHINSDKIFLSGHGMGGDAAFDVGMSHPDVFAGVIPISALAQHYCKWYWDNAKNVPWYLVSGELCRNSLVDPDHSAVLGRMLKYGHEFDVTYAEYCGRGYEHYYEEIHHLFDWMDRLERKRGLKKIEATVLRPFDNRFYWIRAEDFPASMLQSVVMDSSNKRGRVQPVKLSADILDGADTHTTIAITSGAKRHYLQLSPNLIDYGKRLKVRYRSSQKYNEFPEPSLEVMLDDFRERADRQNLVWTQIVIE